MARQAREICGNKVYHVMLRGVNKQQIFECEEDYMHFVCILQRQCGLSVVTRPTIMSYDLNDTQEWLKHRDEGKRHCFIYAWCLMGNHVHLLMKEADEVIGDVVKRISASYVYYYNRKYNRVGHLFQERFKSQPVENWEYFLTLLRYIHRNPLKPHLVTDLKDYKWSSWNEYLGRFECPFSSIDPILKRISVQELAELIMKPMNEEEEMNVMDIDTNLHKTQYGDDEVWKMIEECSGTANASQFQALPRPMQRHYLFEVHEKGVGPRTLSRLTGVSYSIVYRATSGVKKEESLVKSESLYVMRELSTEEEEWLTYCEEGEFDKYPEY